MSRVDVPTLKCDRCGEMTQDTKKMGHYGKLSHPHVGGHDDWDLCPKCWRTFWSWVHEPQPIRDATGDES